MGKPLLHPWPVDLNLTDELALYARTKGLDPLDEFEGFRDYHLARGSRFADWKAAWRTWCRNASKWKASSELRSRPIGFTRPQARQPEQVRQAIADNEAAALETQHMTLEQRRENIKKMSALMRPIWEKERGQKIR